eukprot:CAMPEP_0169301918 /NCGR_PEP_ID=MMETSP1016-20121227/68515_1 /TAXON_ID=342587 /ORGANISM="Karlodinium micrum, Strain CCMP2283" /LENGTH=620 /DNA_ID=CAMNT_0009394579 /DNA_START=33 /DNA_END=1891 /DNA_ORIENTATION=-
MAMFAAEIRQPLLGSPFRVGDVWHLLSSDGKRFEPATLSLYANGLTIKAVDSPSSKPIISLSWSPFSLVQACRLHTVEADASRPWLRLFKVSIFHHDTAHLFAAQGETADAERARWVADIARALRLLTQSLFPAFDIRADPVCGAGWTTTRLLAGYMLMCEKEAVSVVYCELHTHWDISMGVHTSITERVGIDCSCFSVDGHHFSTEKSLWLRAISNVKVKLRHGAANPSESELAHYRTSVIESARNMRSPKSDVPPQALLPRRDTCPDEIDNGAHHDGNGFLPTTSLYSYTPVAEPRRETEGNSSSVASSPSKKAVGSLSAERTTESDQSGSSSAANPIGPKIAPPQHPMLGVEQLSSLSNIAECDDDLPASGRRVLGDDEEDGALLLHEETLPEEGEEEDFHEDDEESISMEPGGDAAKEIPSPDERGFCNEAQDSDDEEVDDDDDESSYAEASSRTTASHCGQGVSREPTAEAPPGAKQHNPNYVELPVASPSVASKQAVKYDRRLQGVLLESANTTSSSSKSAREVAALEAVAPKGASREDEARGRTDEQESVASTSSKPRRAQMRCDSTRSIQIAHAVLATLRESQGRLHDCASWPPNASNATAPAVVVSSKSSS